MRLFISYARVDQRFCAQIAEILSVHELWFDKRIYAGAQWWEEILKQLDWCEGFVYLLSPESITSEYCYREFCIALQKGKHIFPVMIQPDVSLPEALRGVQHVDVSKGLTVKAVTGLLNSIWVAEREGYQKLKIAAIDHDRHNGDAHLSVDAPGFSPDSFIEDVADAFEQENYDRAVFLLQMAQQQSFETRFIDIRSMLAKAEKLLEEQSYIREASREYRSILSLIRRKKTRSLGCNAFRKFRQQFPDYDPENVSSICSTVMVPMLQWCEVSEGEIGLERNRRKVIYYVDEFSISKYPITNAQFRMFVEAADGYCDPGWWEFDASARLWRKYRAEPTKPHVEWGDHPRANVSWYEAMAFCNWLSWKTGMQITLPSEQEWKRAAQGEDNRQYPWGGRFDKNRCNTREGKIKKTTPVTRYPDGASPYGAADMAGNIWEWCLTARKENRQEDENQSAENERMIKGGSYRSPFKRARLNFSMYRNPSMRFETIGFRVVAKKIK